MNKTILILLLVILLAGGGVAFAEYSPAEFFTFARADDKNEGRSDSEECSEVADAVIKTPVKDLEPGDDSFGQTISAAAKEGGSGKEVSEAARSVNNEVESNDEHGNDDENGENEGGHSEVATAVLETLGGETMPGDDNSFGQAVSSTAKEGELGPSVPGAARDAAGGGNRR